MNTLNFQLQDALDPRATNRATPLIHTGSGVRVSGGAEEPRRGPIDAVLEQRRHQWGDTYRQIAGDWEELLDVSVSDEEFIAMMIVLKLRRWRNSGYTAQDCLTDIVGYAKLGLSL